VAGRSLIGTGAQRTDIARAQLLLRELPREFTTLVGRETDDIADGVAELVKASVPRSLYPNVYSVMRGWVTTGRAGARGSKTKYIVELRVSPRGRRFSGFRRPNPTYPVGAMAYWYEYGAKGGDDFVDVTLSTGRTKSVERATFDDYTRRVQSQYVERYVDRRGNVRTRTISKRAAGAEQIKITSVAESASTRQLPPYRKAGHWITPALDRNADDIFEAWLIAFDRAVQLWEAGEHG
jgi:hypothetical protein